MVAADVAPVPTAPRGILRSIPAQVDIAVIASRLVARTVGVAIAVQVSTALALGRIAEVSAAATATAVRGIARLGGVAVDASLAAVRFLGRIAAVDVSPMPAALRGLARVAGAAIATTARAFLPRDFAAIRWLVQAVIRFVIGSAPLRFVVLEGPKMRFPMVVKDGMAVQPQGFDWRGYLSRLNAVIVNSEWIVPAGLELVASSIEADQRQTTVILGGGGEGRVYQVTNRITTDTGIVQDRTFTVRIEEQ